MKLLKNVILIAALLTLVNFPLRAHEADRKGWNQTIDELFESCDNLIDKQQEKITLQDLKIDKLEDINKKVIKRNINVEKQLSTAKKNTLLWILVGAGVGGFIVTRFK